jgi:glycosyltransferase involved in cell wall biosynthesis
MEVTAGNAIHTSSAHEIAEAMRAIAANPRLRNTLRGCGLERAAAFSWARTARETRAVYEEVLQTVRFPTHLR